MGVEWVSSKRHDRVHSGSCSCPACRKRAKLYKPEERRKLIAECKARRKEWLERQRERREGGFCNVPLFCRVFPEGLVGSCGFRVNGYCLVFEEGCVRWNELGDKKDYSVGKANPFGVDGGEV